MLSSRALQSLAFDCFFPDQTDDAQELSKLGEIDLYSPKDERNFRNDEIKAMISMLYGPEGAQANPHAQLLDEELNQQSTDQQYVMKCSEFIALCKRHSMLMFPAYNLQARPRPCFFESARAPERLDARRPRARARRAPQETIRSQVCGPAWWKAQTRAMMAGGDGMAGPQMVYRMLRANKLGGQGNYRAKKVDPRSANRCARALSTKMRRRGLCPRERPGDDARSASPPLLPLSLSPRHAPPPLLLQGSRSSRTSCPRTARTATSSPR